jgi:hypothetical protein
MSSAESLESGVSAHTGSSSNGQPPLPPATTEPEHQPPEQTPRESQPPTTLLDLIDRIMIRATSSLRLFLMNLVLIVVFFAGLGVLAHILVGVSSWEAAIETLGSSITTGLTALLVGRRKGRAAVRSERSGPMRGLPGETALVSRHSS